MKRALIWGAACLAAGLGLLLAALFAYIGVVNRQIDTRIAQLHSARSTQFFALYPPFHNGQQFTLPELKTFLEDQGYEEVSNPDEVTARQFAWDRSGGQSRLFLFRDAFHGAGHAFDSQRARLTFDNVDGLLTLKEIWNLDGRRALDTLENVPKKIGAFFAGRLRTQNSVNLSDIPVSVRLAVMAIEDVNFLEHAGVSLRSTVRALLQDIKSRKFAEGGSTLTQQLMKNLFFSREKTLSRKLKEALWAFVTEARHSKEAILEAYLNEVYLGQWSTHEIHGVSEGARYYFNRPVSELSLTQSATLAAIIQAPNAHDPRRFPERTLKRRNLVLNQMLKAGFILPDEYEMAIKEPLGVVSAERSLDDADYFLDLVMDRLPSAIRGRMDTDAYTIYTTLNPFLQTAASRVLKANIDRLTRTIPGIKKKEKRGIHLQGALIAISVKDCSVISLQGGKSYRQTQFNRVLEGKRQPGSLFKPFVYLTAFWKANPPITPIVEIEDAPFEWPYDGQVWKPHNYDGQFRGPVSVRWALEDSLNVPAAKVAQKVGIPAIVETLTKAGIKSKLPVVPSITLGSADVTPFEMAEAYTTVANLGKACALRPFMQIFDENKALISDNPAALQDALPPQPTFEAIQLMKGVIQHGTGRGALASGVPLANFAGKTGTTNDFKDAWFVGFSPELLTLVWVGYDEEEKVGLTGGVAAVPIWSDFLKSARPFLSAEDFATPDGVMAFNIDPKSKALATSDCANKITEFFIKGTEPTQTAICTAHP